MNIKVDITNGDVGPTVLPNHWKYRPYQIRKYSDGLVVLLEYSTATINGRDEAPIRVRGTVWILADGLNGGSHGCRINNPSDMGALVRGFRNRLRKLGLYGDYGVWDEDGRRLGVDVHRPFSLTSRTVR